MFASSMDAYLGFAVLSGQGGQIDLQHLPRMARPGAPLSPAPQVEAAALAPDAIPLRGWLGVRTAARQAVPEGGGVRSDPERCLFP